MKERTERILKNGKIIYVSNADKTSEDDWMLKLLKKALEQNSDDKRND